jgi:hypothetical protein
MQRTFPPSKSGGTKAAARSFSIKQEPTKTKKESDIEFLRKHPDSTSTILFKVAFAFVATGFVVFLILFIFDQVRGQDPCLPGAEAVRPCTQQTKFTLTWTFTWSADNNGANTPATGQFGVPIGATSQPGQPLFWVEGQPASPGMASLANGVDSDSTLLEEEIEQAGQTFFVARSTNRGVVQVSTSFVVQPNHTYLTLAAPLIPSPDWFVGVSGLNLCNAEGNWINYISEPLMPLSAGTKDGDTFDAPDAPCTQDCVIRLIKGNTLVSEFDSYPLGSVNLTRVPIN